MSCTLLLLAMLLPTAEPGRAPIALHPDNPHYFLFRGKPTILVTSGEHYGAVLNLDFDFIPYLDELASHGFNQTRTFSGTYREVPGSFRIQHNTLAPRARTVTVRPGFRPTTAGSTSTASTRRTSSG